MTSIRKFLATIRLQESVLINRWTLQKPALKKDSEYENIYVTVQYIIYPGVSASRSLKIDFFDGEKNVEQYFPLGYVGHYNANGYRKISEIISEHLDQ